MEFWTMIMVVGVVLIVTEFIIRIVKIGTRHAENLARIKHGYPTLDGTVPTDMVDANTYDPADERLQ